MAELLRRFRDWRAEQNARSDYQQWLENHPNEARIIESLDMELRYSTAHDNPRRLRNYENARNERRSLGLRDELAPLARELPFRFEEALEQHPSLVMSTEELALIRQVNMGYWLRVGLFTPGIRRLRRLG